MGYEPKLNWTPESDVTESDFNRIEKGIYDAHEELADTKKNVAAHKAEVANQLVNQASNLTRLSRHNTQQDRSLAYLMLKQDATDRINAPHTFADDFIGNSFGLTYNEAESENIVFRGGSALMLGKTEDAIEVEDTTIVNQAYSTEVNGSRKFVKLENGWLVALLHNGTSSNTHTLYVSKDSGLNWELNANINNSNYLRGASITAIGNKVGIILPMLAGSERRIYFALVDVAITDSSTNIINLIQEINAGANGVENTSVMFDRDKMEIHVTWSSVFSTYSSNNIRYAKGVVSAEGNVAWSSAVNLSTLSTSSGNGFFSPTIILRSGHPYVFAHANAGNAYTGIVVFTTMFTSKDIGFQSPSEWGNKWVFKASSNILVQEFPSVCVDKDDTIHLSWQGLDSTTTGTKNIYYSKSSDGGVGWSVVEKLTNQSGSWDSQLRPSISSNNIGEIYILFYGRLINNSDARWQVRMLSNKGEWGGIQNITSDNNIHSRHPTAICDSDLHYSFPLFIFEKQNTEVSFYGTWKNVVEAPTHTASLMYDLPSTDYVGAFLQREGAVNVEAYVNNELIEAELIDNEYAFTKAIDEDVPIKLRLELSRDSIDGGNNDKLTRLLGGRA